MGSHRRDPGRHTLRQLVVWRGNPTGRMADKATASGEWKHGLCDCCNPVDAMCCYSLYCNPCDLYDQSEHMEPGSGLFSLICGFVCPIIPLIMNRGKVRERDGIEGNGCGDCCSVCCCPARAAIQLRKQVAPAGCVIKDMLEKYWRQRDISGYIWNMWNISVTVQSYRN